jgi:hypothetical protein
LPEELEKFSVTLNFNDGDGEKDVVEVYDRQAIQRLLDILGRSFGGEVRTKAEIEAQIQDAEDNFTDVTRFQTRGAARIALGYFGR